MFKTASTLKRRNGLVFGFTSQNHSYFFVTPCIYIVKLQRACFSP